MSSLRTKLMRNAAAAASALALVAFLSSALAQHHNYKPSPAQPLVLAAKTTNGGGNNGGGGGSTRTITIVQTPGTVEGLYPGNDPIPVVVTLGNPNNQAVAVTGLTGTVASVDKQPTCGTFNVTVTQLPSSDYPFTIDAGKTTNKTLYLQMVSSPAESCKGATFTINYSASGGAA